MTAYGNPGDIIDIFGEIINISNDGVKVEIQRIMNNLPSNTWESSMCIGFCLPSTQDTASAIIAAGDTLDFSFHFFTDALMIGTDTARARIRFKNANGNQSSIMQHYKGITYAQTTNTLEIGANKNKIGIFNVLGGKSSGGSNKLQIVIYDDGTVEKRIVVE